MFRNEHIFDEYKNDSSRFGGLAAYNGGNDLLFIN